MIGYFFVPLGIYFTSLVSPAFVRRSKQNGARETVIEESSGSTRLSAFAKREENAAKSVNEDVYRREHAEQVGIVVAMYAFLISAIFIFPPFFLFFTFRFEWIKYLFFVLRGVVFRFRSRRVRKEDEIFRLDETVAVLEIGGGIFSRAVAQIRGFGSFKNYIFGYHPHGVISVGALLAFAARPRVLANSVSRN